MNISFRIIILWTFGFWTDIASKFLKQLLGYPVSVWKWIWKSPEINELQTLFHSCLKKSKGTIQLTLPPPLGLNKFLMIYFMEVPKFFFFKKDKHLDYYFLSLWKTQIKIKFLWWSYWKDLPLLWENFHTVQCGSLKRHIVRVHKIVEGYIGK